MASFNKRRPHRVPERTPVRQPRRLKNFFIRKPTCDALGPYSVMVNTEEDYGVHHAYCQLELGHVEKHQTLLRGQLFRWG